MSYLNQSGFIILIALTLLMRIVWSFVWREFSSVGREEWYNEMNYGQKLKLGDAHVTPRNIQEVQASKLGDAPKHPHFHHQNIRSSLNALHFLLLLTICVILGASLFLFSVLFCFVFNKVGPHHIYFEVRHAPMYCIIFSFGVRHAPLFCIRTLQFSLSLLF